MSGALSLEFFFALHCCNNESSISFEVLNPRMHLVIGQDEAQSYWDIGDEDNVIVDGYSVQNQHLHQWCKYVYVT